MTDATRAPAAQRSGRYSTIAILLHWTIAALIVLQVALAGRMEGPPTPQSFAVTQLHKSVGITVLLLSLARLAWRLANPPPPEPATLKPWELRLSGIVHWAFYAVMILMPLTGWIMVSTSRLAVPTLLYGAVPWPHVPGLAELAAPDKKLWHDSALLAHHTIIKGAYVLLALHVAGALKHQFFAGEEPVLPRMAPGATSRSWFEPRLVAIALAFVGVIAFGRLVQPPGPHMGPPPAAVAAAAPGPVEAESPAPAVTPVATAPAPAPAAAAPALKDPVGWQVQSGSAITFSTSWSGSAIEGRFDRWTADILFSPDALDRSKVTVSIDLGSVNTGDSQRDASLPTSDWFDAGAHPKAVFTATKFEKTGEGRYVARGELSLRGVKRPMSLPFRLKIDGDRAEASGVTSLDRTAFGVGQGEWQSTDQIPAKVSVRITVKAKRT